MKTLTLYQPYATLIAVRAKRIETRSWSTKYRGLLAIHASKKFPELAKQLIWKPLFHEALSTEAFDTKRDNFPLGMVVAICNLEACFRIDSRPLLISDQERTFGDYTAGRFMWFLENVRELKHPIPAKGALGLWEWIPPQGLEFK